LPAQTAGGPKLQIRLVVNSFDGTLGAHTAVDIRWAMALNPMGPWREGHFRETSSIEPGYAALVQGLNRALDRFSETLAREAADLAARP